MTEVLNVTSALRRSPASSSSLFLDSAPSSIPSSPRSTTPTFAFSLPSASDPAADSFSISSEASSQDESLDSTDSTGTALTLDTDLEPPHYVETPFNCREDHSAPPSSPACCEDCHDDEAESTDTTRSDTPLHSDDTAVKQHPTRQVDFLSHEWREEDIWSSWRHIVSQRAVYGERSRLENASWRTWAKAKFDLRTLAPEQLNWLKESDVTWLYGPLKQASYYPISKDMSEANSLTSKNDLFISKKPILKKRSMSEVMLQRSISSSSLVKQAADRIQAQGRHHRRMGTGSDVVDSKLQSETPSRDQVDYFASRSTSDAGTPSGAQEKRHIRFDERVEQCIAVDCKDNRLDQEDDSEDEEDENQGPGSDSSSDDGIVLMKRKRPTAQQKKRRELGSRRNSSSGRKIIETLPATTLKYRTDSPDVTERYHTFGGRSWNAGKLSPSPSQETLRPKDPASNFLLPDAEDGDDVDSDSSWSFGASNPKSSLGASSRTIGEYEVEGMRRTNSGMLMPYHDEEDEVVSTGLFGRVSETINTARDIAHVIWNVGWRS